MCAPPSHAEPPPPTPCSIDSPKSNINFDHTAQPIAKSKWDEPGRILAGFFKVYLESDHTRKLLNEFKNRLHLCPISDA